MIITIVGRAGQHISLDLREQFREGVEIDCFQFIVPPIEFRLVRNGAPLQDWQAGSTETYDLQHPARADRKSTRLNSSHSGESRMPSSA